jgi:hypothetical protein
MSTQNSLQSHSLISHSRYIPRTCPKYSWTWNIQNTRDSGKKNSPPKPAIPREFRVKYQNTSAVTRSTADGHDFTAATQISFPPKKEVEKEHPQKGPNQDVGATAEMHGEDPPSTVGWAPAPSPPLCQRQLQRVSRPQRPQSRPQAPQAHSSSYKYQQ